MSKRIYILIDVPEDYESDSHPADIVETHGTVFLSKEEADQEELRRIKEQSQKLINEDDENSFLSKEDRALALELITSEDYIDVTGLFDTLVDKGSFPEPRTMWVYDLPVTESTVSV